MEKKEKIKETTKHLWEVEHDYYCNLGNYYSNEPGDEYDIWEDFLFEWEDSDMSYNLLFRWDWVMPDPEDESKKYKRVLEDPNYRGGELRIFWMLQRKGLYTFSTVKVSRSDEPEVRKFLQPRLKYLLELWEPLT